MESEVRCNNCNTQIIIVEDKLFFSEEQSEMDISCPICSSILSRESTDGWFFTQAKDEYQKELEIEKKKEQFIYPMP